MKAIMLHIHPDVELDNRLQVALDLARLDEGRISCVQIVGVEPYAMDFHGEMVALAAMIDTRQDQHKLARQAIEARLQREAIDWDWRCFDSGVVETLISQSRLADVLVVSQPAPGGPAYDQPLAIVGDVAVHTSAPLLVVPIGCHQFDAGGPAILAWNGSAEAAHAMRLAVPLLAHARCVHVIEVCDDGPPSPGTEAATYLTRHGINCEVHDWPAKGRRTSAALLNAAAELEARYIVMGAYGHHRLRETILGGVTRELIASTHIPLFMAH